MDNYIIVTVEEKELILILERTIPQLSTTVVGASSLLFIIGCVIPLLSAWLDCSYITVC